MIYVYIIVGIAVLIVALLGYLGWKTKRVEARLKKKLGLDKSTTKEEFDKAVAKFTMKQKQLQNTLTRNIWLASKGYTVPIKREYNPKRPKPLSGFVMALKRFRKLKFQNKIEIYPAKRDKFAIPYYEIRKTAGEQIRGIA